jgi:hypothetical protein
VAFGHGVTFSLLLELSRLFAAEADDARDGVTGDGGPTNLPRPPDKIEAGRLRLISYELRARAARKGNAA